MAYATCAQEDLAMDLRRTMSQVCFNCRSVSMLATALRLTDAERHSSCCHAGADEVAPRKRYKQQELAPLLQNGQRAELDDCAADLFYGTGISLHLCRYVSSAVSSTKLQLAADRLG
jgi:hypothetical protein